MPLRLRLYIAQVAIIPILQVALFVVHMALIKRHHISPHPGSPTQRPSPESRSPTT